MPDEKEKNLFDFDEITKDNSEEPAYPSIFRSNLLTEKINEIPMCDLGALKLIKFRVEATEDYIAGSTFSLCKIPASEIRLLFKLSMFEFEGIGDGEFGHTKYRTRRRENLPRSVDAFSKAVFDMRTIKVDSIEGIFFNFTVSKAGKKGDAIEGYIVYSKM